MSETEERLFGLMVVVEGLQATVQVALDGLKAEVALLRGEREAQARQTGAAAERQQAAALLVLKELAREQALLQREREALARGVAAMETSAAVAVGKAVNASLASAATAAAAAVEKSARPLLERLGGVAAGAEQAEAALRRVVLWASWRLLGRVMVVAMLLMLLGWLSSMAVVWGDAGEIAGLNAERTRLEIAVAGLEANQNSLVKAGMLAKLQHCGPGYRFCIQVDESAGSFGKGNVDEGLRIIKGY